MAYRLPGYDHRTRGSELVAFSSLGLVAVALIGCAIAESARFATERDCIVATLSGGSCEGVPAVTWAHTNHAATNLAGGWGWRPEEVRTEISPLDANGSRGVLSF